MLEGISKMLPSMSNVAQNQGGKYSIGLPISMSKETAFKIGVALICLANLPGADAGGGAYFSCINTCIQGVPGWWGAVACPAICAPFLLAPGA